MRSIAAGGLSLGIIGTGFVSRHLAWFLADRRDVRVAAVLTRRDPADCAEYPLAGRLTRDLQRLIDASDLVVECSGDPIHATEVVAAAVDNRKPVVTMNAEFHVTSGSAFTDCGVVVTEAEGDQPGSLAAFAEDLRASGFSPLIYGSLKGFLDHTPSRSSMAEWATRQGTSIPMTTSFTDGTKLQIEQALVCNGLGASIACRGMVGPVESDLDVVAEKLVPFARAAGEPIADYALAPGSPHGVFIVAEHAREQERALRYLKLGDGPTYVLLKNNILAHLEILKTIKRVVEGRGPLIDNSTQPRVGVAAIAKRCLEPGTRISRAIGGYDVRGEVVLLEDEPDHVPIGLLTGAEMVRRVEPGAVIRAGDAAIPGSAALDCWHGIRERLPI